MLLYKPYTIYEFGGYIRASSWLSFNEKIRVSPIHWFNDEKVYIHAGNEISWDECDPNTIFTWESPDTGGYYGFRRKDPSTFYMYYELPSHLSYRNPDQEHIIETHVSDFLDKKYLQQLEGNRCRMYAEDCNSECGYAYIRAIEFSVALEGFAFQLDYIIQNIKDNTVKNLGSLVFLLIFLISAILIFDGIVHLISENYIMKNIMKDRQFPEEKIDDIYYKKLHNSGVTFLATSIATFIVFTYENLFEYGFVGVFSRYRFSNLFVPIGLLIAGCCLVLKHFRHEWCE